MSACVCACFISLPPFYRHSFQEGKKGKKIERPKKELNFEKDKEREKQPPPPPKKRNKRTKQQQQKKKQTNKQKNNLAAPHP